jgi:hypothetical protein
MWILDNIEARQEGGETATTEYAVMADHHFVGGWSWKGYHLRIWELALHRVRKGEERRLNLRLEYDPDLMQERQRDATPDAYYHGGGLAEEIVSLASLFLRARLFVGPQVRDDDEPRWIEGGHSGFVDPGLVRDRTDLGALEDWFPLVEGLRDEVRLRFMLAVRLYHQAIGMVESDPDLAYLTLVSAVEVLAEDHPIGEVSLADLDEGLDDAVGRVDQPEVREEIRERILNRQYFTRRRFRQFLLDHIDPSFWEDPGRPDVGRIEEDQLPELLNRIYDQRSKTLHSGEPFPPNIHSPPIQGAELDPSLGMMVAGRRWEPEEYVPNPHFFERLVNHCLKEYLKRHQDDG